MSISYQTVFIVVYKRLMLGLVLGT